MVGESELPIVRGITAEKSIITNFEMIGENHDSLFCKTNAWESITIRLDIYVLE